MIEEAPRAAEEAYRRQREELVAARQRRRRSTRCLAHGPSGQTLQRCGGGYSGRRVSLRKERREGRLVFLVLVIALAAAVLWLLSHLPS